MGNKHTREVVHHHSGISEAQFNAVQQTLNNTNKELANTRASMTKQIEDMNQMNRQRQQEYNTQIERIRKEHEETLRTTQKKSQEAIETIEKNAKEMEKKNSEEMQRMEAHELEIRLEQLKEMQRQQQRNGNALSEQLEEITIRYSRIAAQYNKEKSDVRKFEKEREDSSILRAILYSPTGHGKSTLANRICGDQSKDGDKEGFTVSHGVSSETKEIKKKIVTGIYEHTISIVDQPGVDDSDGKSEDDKHANNLVEYLRGIGFINAILLVKTIIPPRISSSYQKMLKDLETMLGRGMWKHVVIVFTAVEGVNAEPNKLKEYIDSFTTDIRNKMNLLKRDAALPVVALSNYNNYERPLERLFNEIVPNLGVFECKSLVSPLEQLKLEKDTIEKEQQSLQQQLRQSEDFSNRLAKQIQQAEARLQQLKPNRGNSNVESNNNTNSNIEVDQKQTQQVAPNPENNAEVDEEMEAYVKQLSLKTYEDELQRDQDTIPPEEYMDEDECLRSVLTESMKCKSIHDW